MTAWAQTTPLADQLFDEWNTTHAHTLHRFGSLGELTGEEAVKLIRQEQRKDERDAILIELLTLEHQGDAFAGRVLLKSFLPLALRMPATVSSMRSMWQHSPADARTAAIGVLWEILHTYPLHCASSVAGNIRGRTLKGLCRWFGSQDSVEDTAIEDEVLEKIAGPDESDDIFRDLVTILSWAIDSGTLRRDEVQLLARIELAEGDPGQARDDAASDLGISRETLNKRVSRIRHRLMTAVSGDLETKIPYAPRRR
ncbi:hypothetical protein [Microbacterium lacticum]|uniref:hypothetical protein n=1 Tax=Microbacterium lacticum TaxID=33885 RepID=UPI001F573E49|nr:hypothetical protein [Microbacterium lacticum]